MLKACLSDQVSCFSNEALVLYLYLSIISEYCMNNRIEYSLIDFKAYGDIKMKMYLVTLNASFSFECLNVLSFINGSPPVFSRSSAHFRYDNF